MKQLTFSKGDLIIEEGALDQKLFILKEGTLEVLKNDHVVASIESGSTVFGELSSLLGKPRSCSVRAASDCRVMEIGESIDAIIDSSPVLTRSILVELARRLESTTEKLADSHSQLIAFKEPA